MKRFAFALLAVLVSNNVMAETINVEYSRFYSHIKKLDNEDTQALQFAFGFIRVGEGRLCGINQADIVTDKQTIPLSVSDEFRFTVPKEKALKLANAYLRIDLAEAANVCDMSVQLETQSEYVKASYTQDELNFLYAQYEAFFNEMGSFLSFLMPTVKGLMLHFDDKNLDYITPEGVHIINGVLNLDQQWINSNTSLTLPFAPRRITAMASS